MFVDDNTRVMHMLDAARDAVGFVTSYQRADLDTSGMLYHALKDCLTIVGEAAFKLTHDFKDVHPEIDWRSLVQMRNRLVHDYFTLDKEAMWNTATDVLPGLIEQLELLAAS
jgi:uncharacterized protein with HEPN domain